MASPQFSRKTHRAREHLLTAGRLYPTAWADASKYREMRGQGIPDWPDWCYLPIAATMAIVATDAGCNVMDLGARHPDRVADGARLAALAAWRMTQGIYRFDPALYDAVAATPLTGDLPTALLQRMPEWCVYIETPGHSVGTSPVHGAWCHLEHDVNTSRMELRFILDGDSSLPLAPFPLHLVGTLDESIASMTAEAARQADRAGIDHAADVIAAAPIADAVRPIISLLLYLCTDDPDLTRRGKPDTPANPVPKRTRRRGWQLFPASGPLEWDVGVRIGSALRAAYQREQTGGDAAPTGRSVRPHVRRAHWHTFLSGPRLRDDGTAIPSDQRRRDVRWVPPIGINVDDLADLPATIKPVKP